MPKAESCGCEEYCDHPDGRNEDWDHEDDWDDLWDDDHEDADEYDDEDEYDDQYETSEPPAEAKSGGWTVADYVAAGAMVASVGVLVGVFGIVGIPHRRRWRNRPLP